MDPTAAATAHHGYLPAGTGPAVSLPAEGIASGGNPRATASPSEGSSATTSWRRKPRKFVDRGPSDSSEGGRFEFYHQNPHHSKGGFDVESVSSSAGGTSLAVSSSSPKYGGGYNRHSAHDSTKNHHHHNKGGNGMHSGYSSYGENYTGGSRSARNSFHAAAVGGPNDGGGGPVAGMRENHHHRAYIGPTQSMTTATGPPAGYYKGGGGRGQQRNSGSSSSDLRSEVAGGPGSSFPPAHPRGRGHHHSNNVWHGGNFNGHVPERGVTDQVRSDHLRSDHVRSDQIRSERQITDRVRSNAEGVVQGSPPPPPPPPQFDKHSISLWLHERCTTALQTEDSGYYNVDNKQPPAINPHFARSQFSAMMYSMLTFGYGYFNPGVRGGMMQPMATAFSAGVPGPVLNNPAYLYQQQQYPGSSGNESSAPAAAFDSARPTKSLMEHEKASNTVYRHSQPYYSPPSMFNVPTNVVPPQGGGSGTVMNYTNTAAASRNSLPAQPPHFAQQRGGGYNQQSFHNNNHNRNARATRNGSSSSSANPVAAPSAAGPVSTSSLSSAGAT